MATRRVRKSRQSRKVKKGGIFGIPQFKQDYENVRNCQQYWSQNKNPSRCPQFATAYDYPGYINKLRGAKVLNKRTGQPATVYGDGTSEY